MMLKVKNGDFVEYKRNKLGISKVVEIKKNYVEIEYFKSIADRIKITAKTADIKKIKLQDQTRCYYFNEKIQSWQIGRIRSFVEGQYEVDFPDVFSAYLDEKDIFVRCNLSIGDPSEVLKLKGHETAFFNERRTQFMQSLIEQRSVSRGMDGLMSSNILLLPHQVEVVKRVLEDPIQRYILADEVGLGKTIEAGVIVRQYLLDHPEQNALIIVPPLLLDQWQKEMSQRFSIEDFGDRVDWLTLDNVNANNLSEKSHNMIVIDEAHELASYAYSNELKEVELYRQICEKVYDTAGLLLLSATPVLNNEKEFLAMLHLIDPDHYDLHDLSEFEIRVQKRQEVGRFLLSFHEGSRPFMIRRAVNRISEFFPKDHLLKELIYKLESLIEEKEHDPDKRKKYIRDIRVHLSETYRLHRRLLRNKRSTVLNQLAFGRDQETKVISLKNEHDLDSEKSLEIAEIIDEWRNMAWASEMDYWEQDGAQASNLLFLFFQLFEASNSSTRFLRSVVKSRLNLEVDSLVKEELTQGQISLITEIPHFPEEVLLLKQLIRVLDEPAENGGKLELLSMLVGMVRIKSKKMSGKLEKIVIFSNFTVVAREITAYLKNEFGFDSVSTYNRFMNKDDVEFEVEAFQTSEECNILVCDAAGEEGRNLQFADIIIHFDLPFNPNRIEQRVGRLDRIGREKPYKTYILGGTEEKISLTTSWHQFLINGLKVFHHSISSLQFFIEEMMPTLRKEFFTRGVEGIKGFEKLIDEKIQSEKVKLAEQHVLDEIDTKSNNAEMFYKNLIQFEENFEAIEDRFDPWICEALSLQKSRNEDSLFTFYYKPKRGTLVPLDFLLPIYYALDRPGSYDREEVIYHQECNLYRIGNPFIEILRDYIHWDDRGQTFAVWRESSVVGNGEGEEILSFVLNYIIEGNVSYARDIVKSYDMKGIDEKALQRKLDYYFPPIIKKIYVDIEGNEINEEAYVSVLSQPFRKKSEGGTDSNITKDKVSVLSEFIPEQFWSDTIEKVCIESKKQMISSELFKQLCKQRYDIAQMEHSYVNSQMKLRLQAGEFTEKKLKQASKNLDFDEALHGALQLGILHPKVSLDSIGFIVVSGKEMVGSNGRVSKNEGATV
jgi:ATP-dependent helicase HepA